ncbi:hypothetical protein [Pseudaminobacter soli (ex Li et al. 2025)]|uniref:hypothetical protein n=1 Tax=Pseudaminobacter soli (ex Li et al. 2025) TaxID=1295366 RepID=UPI002474D9EF|nr:hypothetical protein [Mesorhizobium soli]
MPIKRIIARSVAFAAATFAIGIILYVTLGVTTLSAVLFALGVGVAANIIRV